MKYISLLMFIVGFATVPASAQKNKSRDSALQHSITQKIYIFNAQTVLPASGRSRQLTSSYSFKVNRDSIESDLPYFGRAYSASLDATQSVLRFDSQKFEYTISPRKKGGWNVAIKFKDVPEVQSISLNIFTNGSASLQVIPTNRQTISFNGTVTQKQ
jgi:hypothetical protein